VNTETFEQKERNVEHWFFGVDTLF